MTSLSPLPAQMPPVPTLLAIFFDNRASSPAQDVASPFCCGVALVRICCFTVVTVLLTFVVSHGRPG